MKKEMFIRLDHFFNVVVAHLGFSGNVFLAQAFLQHLGRCLKVNHQVRRGQLLSEELVIAVINFQLGVSQVDVGEDLVFFEDVVRHYRLARLGPHLQSAQLFETTDKKRKLRLETGAALAFIKRPQERIVFRFDHALRVQPVRDDIGQRALAHPDGPFHCYILWWFKKLGHGFLINVFLINVSLINDSLINATLINATLKNDLLINDSQSADFIAAYTAKRSLAMCNQLTVCGKPARRSTKCLIDQDLGAKLAQFKRTAEFGNWVNWYWVNGNPIW